MLGTRMSRRPHVDLDAEAPPAVAPPPVEGEPLAEVGENRDVSTLLDVAYPMQHVQIRWHALNGGEVAVPGIVQSVEGQMVSVWFDRNAPSFNPLHSDDQVWIDTIADANIYVYAGWIVGMRPPDTMVVLVQGLPRKDQRRQYVREHVTMPPLPMVPVDDEGEPVGDMQEITVIDLSGGGMRVELGRAIPAGVRIMVTFDLNGAPFDVIMTIVESIQTIKGRRVVRGYFSDIEERRRRDIIRFVFREQIRKSRLAPP